MTEQAPGRTDSQPPQMPRWVEIAALVVGVLVLAVVVRKLTGLAGDHGPGRHLSGLAPAPATVADQVLPAAAVA